MSRVAPFVVAAPSNVPDVPATPEPASVAPQTIVEKSSVSNRAPFAGELIVISGGVESTNTSRVSGVPAGSASSVANVWHGSAERICTLYRPSVPVIRNVPPAAIDVQPLSGPGAGPEARKYRYCIETSASTNTASV